MRWMGLGLVLWTACGGGDLAFVSYNAGLAEGFVDGAAYRTPRVASALSELDADVVCLQEVWTSEQVASIELAVSGSFPHIYAPDPMQEIGSDPACTQDDLSSLTTCMEENCSDACDDEVPDCVLNHCAIPFLGLEPDCMRCVQANIGGEVDDVTETCLAETTEYAYDGSFGTMILSRHPLVSVDEIVLPSTTNRRSILHAVVDVPGEDLEVYCTHLSAVFSLIPYPRPEDHVFDGWAEEQAAQIEELLARVEADSTHATIAVLGDMNTGPEGDEAESEVPASWELFDEADFQVPYVAGDGRCTFCASNGLLSETEPGALIDHVMLKGFDGEVSADRIFDGEIDVETCGETVDGALSDHYGIRVVAGR